MRNLGNISDLYEQVKLNEGKIKERKLTDAEKDKLKKLEKEVPMKDFKDRYGKEGEAVYYATLTKMAKKEGFASDAQRRAAFAQGYKAKGKKGKKEEVDIQEDGHVDVASAVRQCKTITEDAMQMLQKLQTMSPEDALPTWWTNKLAVASNNMNKMRDYLLVPSVSEEVELNEAVVSVYGFISTGERKKFLDNLKSMRLQFKSKVMNLPQPAPSSGVLKFDANQSTIEAIIKFAKRRKLKIIKENIDEELDKDDEDTVKTIIGKLKKASQAHAGQAKQLSKDLQDNFSPSMIAKLKKTYEPLKGKKINPNPLMKIFDKIDSNKNGLIQLYKADIPFVSTMAMSRLTLKHNMKADEVKKLREEVELDEMDMKYVLINMHGKVQGYASDEKDAKDIARRTKSTIHKIKKKISDKTLDKMNALNRTPKELQDLGIIEEVELSETIVDFDYSRNPKAIFNAFLQMSRRLNLTLFNAPTGMKDLQSKGTGRIGGTKQNMLKFMKYLNSKGIEPKVEIINEQRSATGYTLFHRSFSDAMQHAYSFARVKMGMIVDPKEIDNKVATGPKKPGTGKTNSYSLKTNKGMLQIQVYNRGGSKPFELNMYSS